MKQTFSIITRYLVAALFIFSGFVKCVDPTGTAIKLEEYFTVFGTDFLIPLSMTFSILMCGVELAVGFMLLFNIRMVWASLAAIALMVVYTPLTLWLAITNKVTDCGCFGDAVTLTNWQTFLKNLALDIFLIFLFLQRNRFKARMSPRNQTLSTLVLLVLVVAFEFFNLIRLPVIDFMPYKVGTNIPSAMTVPENAPQDVWQFSFVYEKGGKQEKFSIDNIPDSTWKFVKRNQKLLKKGYVTKIQSFSVNSPDNMDVSQEILNDPKPVYLLIISNMEKTSLRNFDEINRLADEAISKGYTFAALTASLPEEYELFRQKTKATYPIYMMDETALKTMIRSNPGLMLLNKGTILGKWHHSSFRRVQVQ